MPAFVPQFKHDIFVSYAHLDNRPQILGKDDSGWVSTLKAYLQRFLDSKLGKPVDIWIDVRGLRGNEPVTPEIRETVSESATLLVVLSNSYLESEWCDQELDRFLAAAGGEAAGRVFVVHRDEIPRARWPSAFADLTGYQFYEKDELTGDVSTLGVPQPQPDEKAYHTRLNRLVAQLAGHLKQLRKEGQASDVSVDKPTTVAAVANGSPCVFLAEATNDLLDVREEVKTYLTQSGLQVLPAKYYSRSVSAFQEAMQRELDNCSVFVQLIGPYPPIRTDELPGGYEGLQLECAKPLSDSIPILRWRRPDIDLSSIREKEHRQFLDDGVMAMDLEDFKRHISETVRQLGRQRSVTKADGDPFVLVHADPPDAAVAAALADRLNQCDIGFDIEDKAQLSLDKVAESEDYDGLMVVYGECSPDWVQDRVRELRRVEQTKKHRAPVSAVYIAPPTTKRLKTRYRNLHVIRNADPAKFQSYAAAVTARDVE